MGIHMRAILLQMRRFWGSSSSIGNAIHARAAVAWTRGAPLKVEQVLLDAHSLQDDEILVKVHACGVCHTDLAVRDGHIPTRFPIVLGHEGAGIVQAVGKHVSSNIQPGDQVLMSFGFCGTCSNCHAKKYSYCLNHRAVNFEGIRFQSKPETYLSSEKSGDAIHASFFRQSAFSTHAIAAESNVVKVNHESDKSSHIDLKQLAPLGCGLQTGAGAVLNTLQPPPGSSIAVLGCGSVGLSALMAAKIAGCDKIYAVDKNHGRLDLAVELGATKSVQSLDELDGMLDYAIDTTGIPTLLSSAFQKLKPAGTAVLIGGSPPGSQVQLPMLSLLLGRKIQGVIQGDSISKIFLPKLIEYHRQGKFPYDKLIKYYDGLDSVNQAIEDSHNGSTVKPVIIV